MLFIGLTLSGFLLALVGFVIWGFPKKANGLGNMGWYALILCVVLLLLPWLKGDSGKI